MRIMFVTHYSSLYGANCSLLNLIEGLKNFGVSSYVICPSEGKIVSELKNKNIPFSIFGFSSWMGYSTLISRMKAPLRLARNLTCLPGFVRLVKEWAPDIIYTNSSVTPVGALAAILTGKAHIWHIREFGKEDYRLIPDWGEKIFKSLLNKADSVIAISDAIKNKYKLKKNPYVIYNGVITRAQCEENIKKQPPFTSEGCTLAIVGALDPTKRQEHAIEALAIVKKRYPLTRLLIAGTGEISYTNYLKALCRKLSVDEDVDFLGYCYPFDVYLKADVVLICSKFEAMGRVTAEAMASARPVIGYRSGGTPEIIEHGITGFLYNDGPMDLASLIEELFEKPEMARSMGKNGWEKALINYTIEHYSNQIYNILQKALA